MRISAVNIEFPQADTAKLAAAMARAGKELGYSLALQVKSGAYNIGKTLGTSTRVAPKHIALTKVGAREARLRNLGNKSGFIGTRYFAGYPKQVFIPATTISQARKNPNAILYRRGLAKLSWRASVGGLGPALPQGEASGANSKTRARAVLAAAKDRQLRGDNPGVRVGSFLPYAQSALQGGPNEANTAIERAARMMEHIIDGKLKQQAERIAAA